MACCRDGIGCDSIDDGVGCIEEICTAKWPRVWFAFQWANVGGAEKTIGGMRVKLVIAVDEFGGRIRVEELSITAPHVFAAAMVNAYGVPVLAAQR